VDEPDRSTIWPYEDGNPGDFYYSRYAHPAGVAAEHALGELEGGDALLYASGMAATSTIVLALARPGMTIALAEGAYFGTSVLFDEFARWGLDYVEYDQRGAPPDADIVWVEAPANPVLTMPDLAAVTRSGARTVCDATVATPVYLRGLDEGIDVIVHSATKYLTGQHKALLGATISRNPALTARLRKLRDNTGPIASPDAASALLAGLGTLEERLRRQTESATELAARLEAHPAVETVRYPGFSGLISFDVAPGDAARRVETSTRLITNATSLGGVHSTMESRHRWEGDRIPEGLLRLSVGLEDPEALWADLELALASL
jgi:cystathionine gamma-synthase